MEIVFTSEAVFDLEEIIIWYEDKRQGLSFDFELCLEAGINQIQRNPDSFQKRYKNVKVLFVKRFPYGIHYTIKNNIIYVIGIFHTSQAPKNWTTRL